MSSEDYVFRLFERLQHHHLTQREARKDGGGSLLNTSKTKEMVIDYRRTKPHLQPINIQAEDIAVVQTYKFLGVHKLNWSANAGALYKKGQSWGLIYKTVRRILTDSYFPIYKTVRMHTCKLPL